MTTRTAFKKLIESSELNKTFNNSTVRCWKKRFKEGKLTIAVMENALKKSGAIKTPESWTFRTKQ